MRLIVAHKVVIVWYLEPRHNIITTTTTDPVCISDSRFFKTSVLVFVANTTAPVMDQGGCQLSGGGGGGTESESRNGMITLEDLDTFSEDPLADTDDGSLEEQGETMEEDQDRLLHYWQDIARGHQVEVPQEMAEPIQQLATNNHWQSDRQQVPYTLMARKEKVGELFYEKRHYEKAYWACVTVQQDTYEQSICYGFMRLMKYICQQNSSGEYLGMTMPIVTLVHTNENHSVISRGVTLAYNLPMSHQAQPPQPLDSGIVIELWPATIVYARPFIGATNEVIVINLINGLAEVLDNPGICINDRFIVAGYTNPAHQNRQNEIWFLERP